MKTHYANFKDRKETVFLFFLLQKAAPFKSTILGRACAISPHRRKNSQEAKQKKMKIAHCIKKSKEKQGT